MRINIVKGYPPNYKAIIAVFPSVKLSPNVVFTYGNTIYKPYGEQNLPNHLIKHEEVHIKQQSIIGPVVWWRQYLANQRFRLEQEVEAYRVEYDVIENEYSRPMRRKLLNHIAKNLSGPMYGNIVNKEAAIRLITREDNL